MSSVAQTLAQALSLHRQGRLAEADILYRQILEAQPGQADAWHLSGLVAHQTGQPTLAIERIGRAIALDPRQAPYHNNLGEVHRTLGQAPEAAAAFGRAIGLDPTLAAAFNNLGLILRPSDPLAAEWHFRRAVELDGGFVAAYNNLGNLLHAGGKTAEALTCFERAASLAPDALEAGLNRSAALVDLGRTAEAIDLLQQIIARHPQSARPLYHLAVAHLVARDWPRVAELCRAALALDPQLDEARCRLGNALRVLGDLNGARAAYEVALARNPDNIEALIGYGAVLQTLGDRDAALTHYDRAAQLRPDCAPAHYYRGSVLMFRHLRGEAQAAFREALRLQPNYPDAHVMLAGICSDAGQPDLALAHCRQAEALGCSSGPLLGTMAVALHAQGRPDEAISCYRRSLELRGDDAGEHSNLLYALNFMPDRDADSLFAEHLAWARRHAEPLTAQAAACRNDPTPQRRLRLGYVSSNFQEHAVNFFVEPILAAHDHQQFEVLCYSSTLSPDAVTERLQGHADHWRDAVLWSDEQLAQRVRQDQIDILVDINGHMGRTRLLAFARRPAPVQVTYLGYQNTTGMSAMDYRLTDDWADPPGITDRYYTERLWRLPRAFFCYQPFDTPTVTPLPALAAGHVTFGSFNNFAKVMPAAIEAWLEILSRVPESRLLILAYSGGDLERRLHQQAADRGLDPLRIELCNKRFRPQYLELVARADIALDPFPFNGHTTTCDSVWMGVPVVMLAGGTYASRFGGSVLRQVGLDNLIANSVEQYVERAVSLAADLKRLAALRGELRQRMADSPLLDFAGFTRQLEQAYRQMWGDWCARAGGVSR